MSQAINTSQLNEIIRKAGKLLEKLSLDPQMRIPQAKKDGSPVTPADLKVSEFLVEALEPLGFLTISEEKLPSKAPGAKDSYFLVDPLDGTKYFSRGEQEFAICVGLILEGRPFYGAIYDPIHSRLFWGQKGEGAFCEDQKISHDTFRKDKRVVYSSGFHKRPERSLFVNELKLGEIREKGSALKFCDIAMGDVDLYMRFGPTSEWDTAAAQVILEEANCELYEAKTRRPMAYGKNAYLNRGILAGHKDIMPEVVAFVEKYDVSLKK